MRTPVLTAVAFAIAAAACGSTPKPATPPAINAEAPAPEFKGTPVDAPVVTLIEAGAQPRKELRYAPVRGARASVDARMAMHMTMGAMGQSMPIEIPVMTMKMETLVTAVSATTLDVAVTLTGADIEPGTVDPTVAANVRTALGKMVGMVMSARMDRRGRVLAADATMPAGVDPSSVQMIDSLKQSMSQATAPFPEEPVGVGAKWSVASKVDNSMMAITQTAVFELTALHGDRGDATMVIEQTAAPQTVHLPGTPANTTATLDSLASHGKATLTFDLVMAMPPAFDIALGVDMAMSMIPAGQAPADAMKVTSQMSLELGMAATPISN